MLWTIINGSSEKVSVFYQAWGCFGVEHIDYTAPYIDENGRKQSMTADTWLGTVCYAKALPPGGMAYYQYKWGTSGKTVVVYGAKTILCKVYKSNEGFVATVNDDIQYKISPPYTYAELMYLVKHRCPTNTNIFYGGTGPIH